MVTKNRTALALCAGAMLALAGCGGASEKSASGEPAVDSCRTIAPAEMSQTEYVCALGAEIQAVADAMATIEDRASADRALPALKKSGERIKAIRGQLPRLNSEENVGGKGALAATQLPKVSKASRAMIEQATRLAREHPELWPVIGPVLDGIEL